ncbi:MAG: hypothetical protein JXA60_02440 [Candidatus Coatesbacteria bacterium]|nr:hypothetical protein [Candidatus Coatesbacteria bacterium]
MKALIIFCFCFFILSCTDPGDNTAYGDYSGQTNQSLPIYFNVKDNNINNGYIKIRVKLSEEEVEKEFSGWYGKIDEQGKFKIYIDLDHQGRIEGAFEQDNVNGKWYYPDDDGTASGTFSVSKR